MTLAVLRALGIRVVSLCWKDVNVMKHERIEINPKVMVGKPVIKGTRLPVELILRKLGAGMSEDAILKDHPRLSREDIHAALAFAADYMHHDTVIFETA